MLRSNQQDLNFTLNVWLRNREKADTNRQDGSDCPWWRGLQPRELHRSAREHRTGPEQRRSLAGCHILDIPFQQTQLEVADPGLPELK